MQITRENALRTFPHWGSVVANETKMSEGDLRDLIEYWALNPDDTDMDAQIFPLLRSISLDEDGNVITEEEQPSEPNEPVAPKKRKERKTKQPRQSREKQPRQPKTTKKKTKDEPAIVTQASTPHNILTRYLALDGLIINASTRKKALSILTAVQKAIFNRKVTKDTREGKLFYNAQSNLIRIANPANEGKEIEIANKSEYSSYKRKEKSMDTETKSAMRYILSIAHKTADELTSEDKAALSEVKRLCGQSEVKACKDMLAAIKEFEKGARPILAYPVELSGVRHLAGL